MTSPADLPRQVPAGDPAPHPGRAGRRVYILDLARLAAALMVVSWHLVAVGGPMWGGSTAKLFGPLEHVSRYGWLGVELFFLISGFVICMSAWGRSVSDFAVSRVVRLFPAYWVAVLATAAVELLWPIWRPRPTGAAVAGNLTMFQRFLGVGDLDLSYWTLAVEMVFYLLFAVVVLRGLTYRRVVYFCVGWTALSLLVSAATGLRVMVPAGTAPALASITDAGYSAFFVAGIAFYLIHRFGSTLLLWGLVGFSWLIGTYRIVSPTTSGIPMNRWVQVAAIAVFFAFMAAVSLGWFSWFTWRWAVSAGALTYPLYLIHQVIGLTFIGKVHRHVPHWALLFGVVVGLLVGAAAIHWLIERPLARWLRRRLTEAMKSIRAGIAERTPAPETRRVLILDLFRLFAALAVMSVHLVGGYRSQAWGVEPRGLFGPLDAVSRYGWLGVELFFVISGFVICMSAWGRSVGQFTISRVTRLFPAYWFAVLLTTAVVALWPTWRGTLPLPQTLASLSMLQSLVGVPNLDPSYWTLVVEMLFYLFFAVFVIVKGVTYRRALAFCVLWTLASLAVTTFGNPGLATAVGATYSCYFVAGILLYLVHRFGSNPVLWGLIGFSWLVGLARIPGWQVPGITLRFPVEAAGITLIFLAMSAVALGWFSWFRWRGAVVAGALTYPVYLIHQVIGLTIIKSAHARVEHWVLLAAVYAGLLVAAWLIHRLVERPAARFLKRHLTQALGRMRETEPTQAPPAAQPVTRGDVDDPQPVAGAGNHVSRHAALEPSVQ